MEVVIASNNAHKISEIKAVLGDFFTEFNSLKDKGIDIDVEETADTFEGNAGLKAEAVVRLTGLPALSDDSGLEVEALNGAPGVYSARYSGGTSKDNNALLLKNMEGKSDRRCRFVTVIVLKFPDGREIAARGETTGTLLDEERGEGGFGYDPLFLSDDLGVTFAEASPEEKNAVSHRGRALSKLRKILTEECCF